MHTEVAVRPTESNSRSSAVEQCVEKGGIQQLTQQEDVENFAEIRQCLETDTHSIEKPSSVENQDNELVVRANELQCSVCEKNFNSLQQCQEHFKVCSKSLVCDKCQKRFTHINRYKSHINMCNGLNKYKCYICKVQFTDFKKCSDHVYWHEHKFKCRMCDMKFKSVKSLTDHCSQQHPKKLCKRCNAYFYSDKEITDHMAKHAI